MRLATSSLTTALIQEYVMRVEVQYCSRVVCMCVLSLQNVDNQLDMLRKAIKQYRDAQNLFALKVP